MKKIIEFEGKLYSNYWSLFYELEKESKTPCKSMGGDDDEEYPLEKYILTEVMKLEITERKVH